MSEEDTYKIAVDRRFCDKDVSFRVVADLGNDTWRVVPGVYGSSLGFRRAPIKYIEMSGDSIRSLIEKQIGQQAAQEMDTVGPCKGSRKGTQKPTAISFSTMRELLLSQRAVRARI